MLKTSVENITRFTGLAALLGLWVVVSAFLWSVPGGYRWSVVVVGLAITVLSGYTAYLTHSGGQVRRSVAYLAGLGGLYVIMSPYAFGVSEPNLLLNNFVAGGLIGILTGYSGYVGPVVSTPEARQQAA